MCLYPRLIKNMKYQPNKKNGGMVDIEGIVTGKIDNRVLTVPIGCGLCMECLKQKAKEWQVRLLEDVRHEKNGKFITLTFSNESIKELIKELNRKKYKTENKEEIKLIGYETDNDIATLAVRRFLERWRKTYKKSLRHWFITELGHKGTENIHLHGIVWTNEETEELRKHWKYGYIWIGEKKGNRIRNFVNEKTINYITKYVHKVDLEHKYYKPKILTSAGIGRRYIEREDSRKNKYNKEKTKEYYTTRTGHKMSMPIYWRNKIYTEEEREKLWIMKLDKEERWICGNKIDISTHEGEEIYWKTLKHYRNKNDRLGYGTNKINWNRKKYEEERRNMLMIERITKAK